jgi:hypothetical protein
MWKQKLKMFLLLLLLLGLGGSLAFSQKADAAAGTNQQLAFEGKVVAANGTNIADGTYNMEFKIYNGGTSTGGGTLQWTEDELVSASQAVTVTSGTFEVNLGAVTSLSTVNWNSDTLWLSIQIGSTTSCTVSTTFTSNCGGDGEMTPYIRLTSVPYAFNSAELGGIAASGFGQLSGTQSWTGTNTYSATGGNAIALTGLPAASATSSLLQMGTAISGGSANGTYLGLNTSSATTADLVDLQNASVIKFKVDSAGDVTAAGTLQGTTINATTGFSVGGTQIASSNLSDGSNLTKLNATQSFTGTDTFSATGVNALAVTGAPVATATLSLVRLGNAIVGGNATAGTGGTYLGVNEPSSGVGSTADFFDFQNNNNIELSLTSAGALTENGALKVNSGGINVTGNSTIAGTLGSLTGLTLVSGNLSNAGTYNGNTFTASALTFSGATANTITGAASQSLTVSSGSAGQLTLNSASGTLGIGSAVTVLQKVASGLTNIDLDDTGTTTLQLENSGSGVANLNLYGGSLETGMTPTVRLDNSGDLTNIGTYSGSGNITTTGGILTVQGTGTSVFTGVLQSSQYLLGSDLSLIPISGSQSAISSWWGLQLVGNKESSVSYTPTTIGTNSAYGVLIPNQQAGSVAVLVQGAASQSGDLMEFQNSGGTVLAKVDSAGDITAVNDTFTGTLGGTGLTTLSGGLTESGALSLDASGTTNITAGNGTGTFALNSSAFDVSTAGALSGITTLAASGAITGGTYNGETIGAATSLTGTLGVTGLSTFTGGVQVGSATADATAETLNLDYKNTTGDPTEVDGAMYYNTVSDTFRCGQGGGWVDCIGGLISTNTAASTAVNTCTTACAAYSTIGTIPAGYCVAGKVVHVTAYGNLSTTTTAPTFGAWGLYMGTNATTKTSDTLLAAVTAGATMAASEANQQWRLDATIICDSTTTANTQGNISYSTTSIANQTTISMVTTAPVTVNNSAATNIYLFPAWGTSNAGNTATVQQFVLSSK